MNIKPTAIFDFFLKNFQKIIKFITQSYLFTLLNSFLFLSRFSVTLKSLDNYFFRRFAYKSFLSRFSVLISYNMCSSNHFSISSRFPCFSRSSFFRVEVFQSPGFLGSRFFKVQVFRVQVFRIQVLGPGPWSRVQGPGPGSGSRLQKQPFLRASISYCFCHINIAKSVGRRIYWAKTAN